MANEQSVRIPVRHFLGLKPFNGMYRRWFIRPEWKVADCWVGIFWKRDHPWAFDCWVCLLPCLPIHFGWKACVSQ